MKGTVVVSVWGLSLEDRIMGNSQSTVDNPPVPLTYEEEDLSESQVMAQGYEMVPKKLMCRIITQTKRN